MLPISEKDQETFVSQKKNIPYCNTLSLKVTPSLIHFLQPPVEKSGILLGVQPADQLFPRVVKAEVHIPVLFHLILEVLIWKHIYVHFTLEEDYTETN